MAKKVVNNQEVKPRHRSPNYPAISLPEAVEKVKKLVEVDGKAGAQIEIAVKRIGYNSISGHSNAMLSALKKYKLIEYQNKRVIPTQIAIDIIQFPPGHSRKMAALKQAALGPDIIRELYERFQVVGNLPGDDSLKPELVVDKGFASKAVDSFIVDLKQTLIFAGLMNHDRIFLSSPDGASSAESLSVMSETRSNGGELMSPAILPSEQTRPVFAKPLHEGSKEEITELDEGEVILRMPRKLSAESYLDLKQWVEYVLQKAARSAGVSEKKEGE